MVWILFVVVVVVVSDVVYFVTFEKHPILDDYRKFCQIKNKNEANKLI
jgi:hypothetical protein